MRAPSKSSIPTPMAACWMVLVARKVTDSRRSSPNRNSGTVPATGRTSTTVSLASSPYSSSRRGRPAVSHRNASGRRSSARYRVTASNVDPSKSSRPWLSSSAREHSRVIADMLWLTNRTVRPPRPTSCILPRHFCWNAASPTANTSSTMRISGSRCAATANASRTYIPDEYRFTGVSRKASTSENATISSNLRVISDRRMPRSEPLRYTFSRPVSSGWNPVPTSNRLATRPRIVIVPEVGSVMRLSARSSVLLPAPLRPTIPTTEPPSIENDRLSSARNGRLWTSDPPRANRCTRRSGALTAVTAASRSVV